MVILAISGEKVGAYVRPRSPPRGRVLAWSQPLDVYKRHIKGGGVLTGPCRDPHSGPYLEVFQKVIILASYPV